MDDGLNRPFVIHQLVHGYEEGHRLLASSAQLPKEAVRLITVLSDLSGPEVYPDFEEYLTGYPLLDLRQFVFAKTWYAEEMPRPGCVWTHSLVIDFDDLDGIEDLRRLISLFRRPTAASTD